MTKKKVGLYPSVYKLGHPRICVLEGILSDPLKSRNFTKVMVALKMRLVLRSNAGVFDIVSF